MFRKVVIPAVLGDDSEGSEVAPCNGAYANALVEYEANGDLYIYASDGIYTKLEGTYTEIQKDIEKAIAEQKIYIDSEIASNILAEKTAREEQDEFLHNENVALGNELNEEKNARISGDEGLDRKIDAETAARQQKDTELAQSINNETTERQSEDARINARIDAINSMEYEVVDELPATGKKGVIYLVPKTPQDTDFYKEYIWVNNRFEFIGSTDIDLVNYVKNTDYATTSTGGVVKTGAAYGTQMASSGILTSVTRTYDQYTSGNNAMFIGKATLENVLNGRKYLMPEYTQELPATGEENKLYLTPATEQPDVEASASGKEVELANASEGDLIDWTIKGDTEQNGEPTPTTPQEVKTVTGRNTVSVVGKNLFDKNNASHILNNVFINAGTKRMGTGDGFATIWIECEPNTTYTVTKVKTSRFHAVSTVELPASGVYTSDIAQTQSDTRCTFTTEPNAKYIAVMVRSSSDTLSVSEIVDTMQIEKGSQATTYQSYYKQEVELNLGKNLYNRELDKIGYYLDSNGAEVVAENWHISDFIKVNAGDSYTISGISVSGTTPKSVFYNASKAPVGSFTIENKTIIIPSDTTYIKFSVFNGTGGGGAIIKDSDTLQLERGNKATSYAPVEAFGKNLFDKKKAVNGYVTAMGTVNSTNDKGEMSSDFIKVTPNTTYIFSIIKTTSSYEAWFGVGEYTSKTQESFIRRNVQTETGTSITFTTSPNCEFIRASARNLALATEIQLEKGSKYSSYEPYFDKIELCKLGDYQDRIYKDGSEWKIEKKVGISVGSELGWRKGGYQAFSTTTIFYDEAKKSIHGGYIASNYLRYSTNNYDRDNFDSISIASSSEISIRVSNSIATDITALKNWLDTNSVKIYYSLATTTTLTIANQALIDQLNALETLATAKGYNLVTTDTPTIQPFLEFKYFRPDPTVTKDEWLWVENHYELLGGERRYTHNLSVNHHTAQGHWDYAFTVVGKDASHYTQLAQVAYYLFNEHAGLTIPVSGTYTEGNNIYMLTKISANSLSQVTIEMRKLSDGSSRTITTGAVPVLDTIS